MLYLLRTLFWKAPVTAAEPSLTSSSYCRHISAVTAHPIWGGGTTTVIPAVMTPDCKPWHRKQTPAEIVAFNGSVCLPAPSDDVMWSYTAAAHSQQSKTLPRFGSTLQCSCIFVGLFCAGGRGRLWGAVKVGCWMFHGGCCSWTFRMTWEETNGLVNQHGGLLAMREIPFLYIKWAKYQQKKRQWCMVFFLLHTFDFGGFLYLHADAPHISISLKKINLK